MTEKTCKNCRFWGNYRKGECDAVDRNFPDKPTALFEIDIHVSYDTGLRCGLITGPDFGCVHFFAKEHKNG